MANFWDHHGVFFLIFITLFPRLTLLFSSVAFGGLFWWIGFFFVPRILVAVLATMSYLQTNPVLVIISWLVALSGESTEKYALRRRVKIVRFKGGGFNHQQPPIKDVTPINVDYKRLD